MSHVALEKIRMKKFLWKSISFQFLRWRITYETHKLWVIDGSHSERHRLDEDSNKYIRTFNHKVVNLVGYWMKLFNEWRTIGSQKVFRLEEKIIIIEEIYEKK